MELSLTRRNKVRWTQSFHLQLLRLKIHLRQINILTETGKEENILPITVQFDHLALVSSCHLQMSSQVRANPSEQEHTASEVHLSALSLLLVVILQVLFGLKHEKLGGTRHTDITAPNQPVSCQWVNPNP